MNLGLLFSGKTKLVVIGTMLLVIFVLVGAVRMLTKSELTPDELRLKHMEYMVRLLESYSNQHGAYPQPTVRKETPNGIRHVWGYRAQQPSYASCTVVVEDDSVNAESSACGGNILDATGRIIGWKGTLTLESGLNTIDIAHRKTGRVNASLGDMATSIPIDPVFAALPQLNEQGFGEYVYAVRMPVDGSQNRGGMEYQLAMTVQGKQDGSRTTHVRGNYFVPSGDRDVLPSSLIGPGIIVDTFGNPVEHQERSLHVLLDAQQEGQPNPVLGDGEETLKFLILKQRASAVARSLTSKKSAVGLLPRSAAQQEYLNVLKARSKEITEIMALFAQEVRPSLDSLEGQMVSIADAVREAGKKFLESKADEVGAVLDQTVEQYTRTHALLTEAFESSKEVLDLVLLARDEILKYLEGEGIEEQSRNRAGRKVQSARESVPKLEQLFVESKLILPYLFEAKENAQVDVTIPLISAELSRLFRELTILLIAIEGELQAASISLASIDNSLHRLARAMEVEHRRIAEQFATVVDEDGAMQQRDEFVAARTNNGAQEALTQFALQSSHESALSSLLFSTEEVASVELEQTPGVPFGNTYTGIPYPLP